jgi:hypothetical protein
LLGTVFVGTSSLKAGIEDIRGVKLLENGLKMRRINRNVREARTTIITPK